MPTPPFTLLADLDSQLSALGWAVLDAPELERLAGVSADSLDAWRGHWQDLPPDNHLRDGGHYRFRRHGSFVAEAGALRAVAHRAHWQPVSYNALHGGLQRWFEALDPGLSDSPAWARLVLALAACADRLRGRQPWYVEAHAFRIDASAGIGRPTPEGAHRDGVDLVAVLLVDRHDVKGGETRVFDARGPQGVRFTLERPWSVLLLDDERVIHETTPIQPQRPGLPAFRDTLVLTFRRRAFQDPEPGRADPA